MKSAHCLTIAFVLVADVGLASWPSSPIDSEQTVPAYGALSCVGGSCSTLPIEETDQPISALPQSVRIALRSVVRIRCRTARGDSIGSGIQIAERDRTAYFVTCAHLFDQGRVRIGIEQVGVRTVQGELVALDRRHDLALLRSPSLGLRSATTCDTEQTKGELIAAGFGSNGILRVVRGNRVGWARPQGAQEASLLIQGAVRQGDSGGPLLDLQGRLIGVIWGTTGRETYASVGRPLRELLGRIPRIERSVPQPVQPRSVSTGELNRLVGQWRSELQRFEARLEARWEHVQANVRDQTQQRAMNDQATEAIKRKEEVAVDRGMARTVRMVGLASGLGVLSGIGWWLVERGRRRLAIRRSERHCSPAPVPARSGCTGQAPQPVAIDTPPPPQRVLPETHFVAYEQDHFAKAHQWASEQLARKFPGSVDLLTSLDSLIRQQLAGMGQPSDTNSQAKD